MSPIYPLIFIIIFISSCSDGPKRPEQQPQIDKQVSISDPATKRLMLAQQRVDQAISQKQPQKNLQLLSIIDFLFQVIDELNVPSVKEYQLISDLLKIIDQNYLNPIEKNQLFITQIKVLLYKQQYIQAELLLDELSQRLNQQLEQKNTTDSEQIAQQKIDLHSLKYQFFVNTFKPLAAVKELIEVHPLLKATKTDKQLEENLNTLWELMNTFQVYDLKQQFEQLTKQNQETDNLFGNEDYYLNFQLSGWQQLMLITKHSSQYNKIIKQLDSWFEKYPQHMAGRNFILDRLSQRFQLLTKPQQVALLLPTKGTLDKPAKAIINGFVAAHFEQAINDQLIIRLYDSSEHESIWPSYKRAVYEGADMVIGPFEKRQVSELAESEELIVPTLALNQVKNQAQYSTKNLYQFALTPEDEISMITQKAKQNGFIKAALIIPDSSWGKRLASDYAKKWQELGGMIVSIQTYPDQTYDYSESIKQLLRLQESNQRRDLVRQTIGHDVDFTPRKRQDIDVIFMVAFAQQAKQIPLQITYNHGADIPVYSTSQIISKAFSEKDNMDLNGITYTDMPWLIDSTIPAISRLNKQQNTTYQRLFSFGVDSYQIMPYLKLMSQNNTEQFTGDSGTWFINKAGEVKRQLPTATIVNGQAVLN